jgi:hypothetical protein
VPWIFSRASGTGQSFSLGTRFGEHLGTRTMVSRLLADLYANSKEDLT